VEIKDWEVEPEEAVMFSGQEAVTLTKQQTK